MNKPNTQGRGQMGFVGSLYIFPTVLGVQIILKVTCAVLGAAGSYGRRTNQCGQMFTLLRCQVHTMSGIKCFLIS